MSFGSGKKKGEEKSEKDGREFDIQKEIGKYPAEIRDMLYKYGKFLHPYMVIDGIKQGNATKLGLSTEEGNEIYTLSTGTTEEIEKYWEKRHSDLVSKNITGIIAANALREIYRNVAIAHRESSASYVDAEQVAFAKFPKLEQLEKQMYESPGKVATH